MKAQVYNEDGMCRIFAANGSGMCDVWADQPQGTDPRGPRGRQFCANADAAMKRIRIVRRGLWRKYEWGYEATVRFAPARNPKSRQ